MKTMVSLFLFSSVVAASNQLPLMQATSGLIKSMISGLARAYVNDPKAACYYEIMGRGTGEMYVWATCKSTTGTVVSAPSVVKYSGDVAKEVIVPSLANFQADVKRLFPLDVQKRIESRDYDIKGATDWLDKNTKKPSTGTNGIYTSQMYKATISYPQNWQLVSGALGERHVGSDGHFQFGAVGGSVLDDVCNAWANHERKPFGSAARIEKRTTSGQESCLIWPSSDQPAQMGGQGALIARYPKPVTISGRSYNFLVLWVSQKQLLSVVDSLKFI